MSRSSWYEGNITKRKDGRWSGRIQIDGKIFTFYGKRKSDVQKKF